MGFVGSISSLFDSRRAQTDWPRRFLEYVSGPWQFYQRIPAQLGFSNCREISHFGAHLRHLPDFGHKDLVITVT
jgi:hypothetical protein